MRESSRRAGAVYQPIRDGDDVQLESGPLPDRLMYHLLPKVKGSQLAAKHEVDHQLQLLRAGTPRGARHGADDARSAHRIALRRAAATPIVIGLEAA